MTKQLFTKRSEIDAPADEVFNWHARNGAIQRLSPPWSPIRLISKTPGIDTGTKVHMKIKTGPVFSTWKAEHTECESGVMFSDTQRHGPFKSWKHTHTFQSAGDTCTLEDRIEFELPAPFSGFGPANAFIKKDLNRIFNYRHRVTQRDLSLHLSGRLKARMKIAVTGSNGSIGSSLVPFLSTGGHDIYTLVRRKPLPGKNEIFWDPVSGYLDSKELEGFDAVIHLAGENIGEGRWTNAKKKSITDSRVKGTTLIAETLAGLKNPPEVFLCASAIGYYGETGTNTVDEGSVPGDHFISGLCSQWETSAEAAVKSGIRTAFMRIGVVLTPDGGALSRLLPYFKAGLGACIGNGSQALSWISPEDVIGAVFHILSDTSINGPVNLVSPNPVTNLDFTKILGDVLKRPAVFKIPESIIRTVFGEMGEELLLAGTKVHPSRLLESGYRFYHTDIKSALSEVLGV